MSKRLSITSNVKWLGLANLIVKPFWFLFLLASTRILGAEQFGLYMYAVSFIAIIAIFVEGGIDSHTVRKLSAEERTYPGFVAHSFMIKAAGGVLVGIVTSTALLFLSVSNELKTLLILAVLYSMFNVLVVHTRAIFRAFEVMQYEAISIIVEKGCVILLCLGSLLLMNNAVSFMTGFVCAYFLTSCITLWIMLTRIGLPHWEISHKYLWQEVIKPALPFALMNVFTVIYFRSATLLINFLTGKEQFVGYFNAGYRLVESYMLFPVMIAGPIYPVFVRSTQNGIDFSDVLLKATRIVLIVSTLIAIPIVLYKMEFTLLFFGKGYVDASAAVGVVTLAMIPVGMNFIFGTLVAASGKQKVGNYFIACVTVINLIINFLLIPRYGVVGASATTVLTEGLLAGANMWVVRDYIPWGRILQIFFKIILLVFIAIMVSYILPQPIVFPFNMFSVVVIMIILIFTLKLVSFSEIKKITSAL